MTRKLSPARSSRPAYPTLEAARRLVRGAAFAGGLLACGGAFGDITPPPGPSNGDLARLRTGHPTAPRPMGGPPAPTLKGEIARPVPPMPGGMARPQPEIPPPPLRQPPQPPQPPPPPRRAAVGERLDLSHDGLNRYVDDLLAVKP